MCKSVAVYSCCWCWLASSWSTSPGLAAAGPSPPGLLLAQLVLLLLAWSCASLGLHSVLLDVISDVLLLLCKNSEVLCVAWWCVQELWCPWTSAGRMIYWLPLVLLTWSMAGCCWQLWCCQHQFLHAVTELLELLVAKLDLILFVAVLCSAVGTVNLYPVSLWIDATLGLPILNDAMAMELP
jgi:hypothetical protein